MSSAVSSVRRVVAGALGAGALSGALMFGGAATAQAAPAGAPTPATYSTNVQLADAFGPMAAPEGMPHGGQAPDVMPMWGHHWHHHHHWWNPWRWWWWW